MTAPGNEDESFTRQDLEAVARRITDGAHQLWLERDAALEDGDFARAQWKHRAAAAAEDYAVEMNAAISEMAADEVPSDAAVFEAVTVAKAAELGGILMDGRARAERTANDPANQAWDGGTEKASWDAGTHPAQEKAALVEGSGIFGHVAGEIDGIEQEPFWRLGGSGEADAQEVHDAERAANEGPSNSDFDWTSEEEERAAGVPSAQDADYSEEPDVDQTDRDLAEQASQQAWDAYGRAIDDGADNEELEEKYQECMNADQVLLSYDDNADEVTDEAPFAGDPARANAGEDFFRGRAGDLRRESDQKYDAAEQEADPEIKGDLQREARELADAAEACEAEAEYEHDNPLPEPPTQPAERGEEARQTTHDGLVEDFHYNDPMVSYDAMTGTADNDYGQISGVATYGGPEMAMASGGSSDEAVAGQE